jgi:hypothetical protein
MIDVGSDCEDRPVVAALQGAAAAGGPVRGAARKRKFYIIGSGRVSRASGFEVLNGDRLFKVGPHTFLPPPGCRGFRDYPERPVFLADPKLGRIHRDFEEYSGYWFVSLKMKSVLQDVDHEAFAFIECEVRSAEGEVQPSRWLCDVIRVLDAVDESRSTVRIVSASDGNKVYQMIGDESFAFREDVVGRSHIFRMKCFEAEIVCDDKLRRACRSADLKGISFVDRSK